MTFQWRESRITWIYRSRICDTRNVTKQHKMKKYYVYNDDIGTWSTKAYTAAEILAKYGKGKVTVLPVTPDGIVEDNCVLDPEVETTVIENNTEQAQPEESVCTEDGGNSPNDESGHKARAPHEGSSNHSGLSLSMPYISTKEQIFILPSVLLYTATYRIQGQMPDEWGEPMSYSKLCRACANNPDAVVWATIEGGDSYCERLSTFTAAIKANGYNIRCINIALTVLFMIQGISSTLTIMTLSGKLSEYHSREARHMLYMSFTAAIVLALAAVVGLIIAPGLNKKGERDFVPLIVTVIISLILVIIGA